MIYLLPFNEISHFKKMCKIEIFNKFHPIEKYILYLKKYKTIQRDSITHPNVKSIGIRFG